MLEINQLYNMDCMEGMKLFPDKHFKLAVVDPPYGINAPNMSMGTNKNRTVGGYPAESVASRMKKGRLNAGSGKLKNRALNQMNCDWDFNPPGKEYFDELFRVSENQVIWGGNYFDLPPTRGIICWDKCQPRENFSQWEMAWTSFDTPAALFRYSNTGGANAETKIHPTQKPVPLYTWILQKYGTKGGLILDTHVGSASSLVACEEMGFDYIGFEIDEYYYGLANRRLHDSKAQIKMVF